MRLADSRTLQIKGFESTVIRKNDGRFVIIENVIFVPRMECNILSVVQLTGKYLSIIMKNDNVFEL